VDIYIAVIYLRKACGQFRRDVAYNILVYYFTPVTLVGVTQIYVNEIRISI
jgi:hypothetical protein